MKIEVSHGEIVDKLTILYIKMRSIKDAEKLINIEKEYHYLHDIVENELKISTESEEYQKLLDVNQRLWIVEDFIRDKEKDKSFDSEFIELARSVYYINDERAKIKKEINNLYSSNFIEEKSYQSY